MRAAVVQQFGPPETIRQAEFPAPAVEAGRILVRVESAGVNFADVGMVTGSARRREPPFVPGVEAAGTIEDVGPEVEGFAVGQRVVYWDPMPAAFAEYASVPAWRAVIVPDAVTSDVAVALMVQGATAHYLATDSAPLEVGKSVLVYAAAGGVGHLLTQIAVARGARVIAVVGGEVKVALARRLGADVVINRSERDVLEGVREATGGAGVDVVYDAVGADTFEQSVNALATRGTLVVFGGASGPIRSYDPLMRRGGSVHFTRPGLGDHLRDHGEYESRMNDLFAVHGAGKLTPHIEATYGLDAVGEALSRMASGQTTGKLIVRP